MLQNEYKHYDTTTESNILIKDHHVFHNAGSLIINTVGLLDLRFYGYILYELGMEHISYEKLLINIYNSTTVTNSGCGALIALGRYTTKHGLPMSIAGASTETYQKVQPHCESIIWLD